MDKDPSQTDLPAPAVEETTLPQAEVSQQLSKSDESAVTPLPRNPGTSASNHEQHNQSEVSHSNKSSKQNDIERDNSDVPSVRDDPTLLPEQNGCSEAKDSKDSIQNSHNSNSSEPTQNSNTPEITQAKQCPESAKSESSSHEVFPIESEEGTVDTPSHQLSGQIPRLEDASETKENADENVKETSFIQQNLEKQDSKNETGSSSLQNSLTEKEVSVANVSDEADVSYNEKKSKEKKVNTPVSDTEKVARSSAGTQKETEETPRFVYILSILATIGGFLFGYDIGIVAGSMLFIEPYFKLTTFWQEAIVSGTIAAAAVAALVSGWLTDKIGRKLTIMTSSVVFTAGGVLMGAAPTKEILLIGRIVAGLGVGLASVVVPVYVAESAPVHIRGMLVSLHQLLINTGIIISSILAGIFSYVVPDGWRYMLGMAALPGILQFVGFLFMPESPRWLVGRGQIERAKQVLLRMRGGSDVTEELNDIIQTVREAEKESAVGVYHWIKIMKTRQVRKALFVGCSLLFFQQWCGINTVIYYSGTVLKMAGFPVKYAVWLVTVPNLINFLSSFIGIYLVEKIGRRLLLIISLAGTLIGLIILAVGFQLSAENQASLNSSLIETYINGSSISTCVSTHTTCSACVKDNSCGYCYSNNNDGTCLPSQDNERSSAGRCNESSSTETHFKWAYEYCPSDYTWVALIGMGVFVFAFAPGLGPMPWTINSEIYPLWARSTCNSLAAATAWVCNLVISFTFLTMTEHITIFGTFWMFAAITVIGVFFMIVMLPETKNKTLEEMELLFLSPRHRQELLAHRDNKQTVGI